jgi:hypothetical protein
MRAINGQYRNASVPQTAEILDCALQGCVRWSRLLEKISRDNHEVGFQFDGFLNKLLKDFVEILPSRLKTVLRIAQMQISSVHKAESLQTGYTSSHLAVNANLC